MQKYDSIIILFYQQTKQFNNKMSLKDFTILEKLGQGSFAIVYKVRRLTDQKIYAMKQIKLNKLDKKSSQNALNEIRFLASFHCQNIIAYHEAFFDQQQFLLCIVMQYAEKGDLLKYIQSKTSINADNYNVKQKQSINVSNNGLRFSQIQIWTVLISLLHGVGYLHDRSILHRDIKPQNIFLTSEGKYKLGDLNVSRLINIPDLGKLTQTGTPYYASPEVWNNQKYDQKSDIWSIGCVLYHMAALKPPFYGNNIERLYQQVTKCQIKPIPKYYSNELQKIIQLCLCKQSISRPSVKQLFNNWTVKMYKNLVCSDDNGQGQLVNQKNINLLKTINMPQNKCLLQQNLPKSNYVKQKIASLIKKQQQATKSNIDTPSKPLNNQDKVLGIIQKHKNNESKENKPIDELVPNCQSQCNLRHRSQRSQKRRSSPRTQLSAKKNTKLCEPNEKSSYSSNILKHKNSCQDLNYKGVIMSKMPPSCQISKKSKIIKQFLINNENDLLNNKKSVIKSSKNKLVSRKMIFDRVKSLAAF